MDFDELFVDAVEDEGKFILAGREGKGKVFVEGGPEGEGVRPSHQTSWVVGLYAMLVKIALVPGAIDASAVGLVTSLVSLATPNTPYSGFMP